MTTKKTIREIKKAQEEYEDLYELRCEQFGLDNITENHKEINKLNRKNKSLLKKLKEKLFDIIYKITGEPNSISVDYTITIRNFGVYKFDSNKKASIAEVISVMPEILREIDRKRDKENIIDTINSIKESYEYIHLIKTLNKTHWDSYSVEIDDAKERVLDYVDDIVRKTQKGNYIYYARECLHIVDVNSKKEALSHKGKKKSINFESIRPKKIIRMDSIQIDDIKNYFVKLKKELEKVEKTIKNLINHVKDNFAYYFVSEKI